MTKEQIRNTICNEFGKYSEFANELDFNEENNRITWFTKEPYTISDNTCVIDASSYEELYEKIKKEEKLNHWNELYSGKRCCFCKELINSYGNNPEPVRHSPLQCCSKCNLQIVVPIRAKAARKNAKKVSKSQSCNNAMLDSVKNNLSKFKTDVSKTDKLILEKLISDAETQLTFLEDEIEKNSNQDLESIFKEVFKLRDIIRICKFELNYRI